MTVPERQFGDLYDDDLEQVVEWSETFTVTRREGKARRNGGRGDEQGNRPHTLPYAGRRDRGENSAVCPYRIPVDWERIKDGLGSLKAILSTGPLVWVAGGMGTGSKFGHGERADRDLDGELCRAELVEADQPRSVAS
jgi:hypothetical protein